MPAPKPLPSPIKKAATNNQTLDVVKGTTATPIVSPVRHDTATTRRCVRLHTIRPLPAGLWEPWLPRPEKPSAYLLHRRLRRLGKLGQGSAQCVPPTTE